MIGALHLTNHKLLNQHLRVYHYFFLCASDLTNNFNCAMIFFVGKKSRAVNIIKTLVKMYPNAHCELNYGSDYELLVAVILSAQCTDKRVNLVTKDLFKLANTPNAMLELGQERLSKIIYSCGFYAVKAKNIIVMSNDLLNKHGGKVPNDFDALVNLAGVGRKTANVVLAELFDTGGIAVDTHVFRVSKRLRLAKGDTVEKVERELSELFKDYPSKKQIHHSLIFFGRYCCTARNPNCRECAVKEYCLINAQRTTLNAQ